MKLYNFVAIAVFTMLVSTVWAYEPAPDAQEAPPPHVAAVTAPAVPTSARPQLREGDRTSDGRLVGTPVPERRFTTEENNRKWVDGSIDVNVGGNVTLTPQAPQRRVEYRTRYRTRTRTRTVNRYVGPSKEDFEEVRLEVGGLKKAVGALGDTVAGLGDSLNGLTSSIGSMTEELFAGLDGIDDKLASITALQWLTLLGVATCIIMLIMVFRRLGNAQTAAPTNQPQAPAPAAPTAPAAPVQQVPATTAPAVDLKAREDAVKALEIAKANAKGVADIGDVAYAAAAKANAKGVADIGDVAYAAADMANFNGHVLRIKRDSRGEKYLDRLAELRIVTE